MRHHRVQNVPALMATMLVALLAAAAPQPAVAGDNPGTIAFLATMKTLGESGGEFRRWRITRAVIDEAHPERSEVDVEVDLASVDTGIEERDIHLRGEKFFDVDRYPVAKATLRNARIEDASHFTVDVTLDLHGTTRTFPMRFAIADRDARKITSQIVIRRTDYGVGPEMGWWNPMNIKEDVSVSVAAVVPASGAPVAVSGR